MSAQAEQPKGRATLSLEIDSVKQAGQKINMPGWAKPRNQVV